ncbi:MAG: ribosomal protein S18-alanine N-acetyltransferase [Peptococcaceae bacterium]
MGSETAGTAIELQQNLQSSDIAKRVFVCPMELKHIAQVCLLEQLCFSSPWTERMFTEELEKNPLCRYLVLLDRQNPAEVVAYAGYWKVFDEGHITNVAVHPQWQGQKAGTYLMEQMMCFAKAEGVRSMTLEVRQSNQIARRLYEKLGFRAEGIRKKYYEDNQEDAVIMWYREEGAQA